MERHKYERNDLKNIKEKKVLDFAASIGTTILGHWTVKAGDLGNCLTFRLFCFRLKQTILFYYYYFSHEPFSPFFSHFFPRFLRFLFILVLCIRDCLIHFLFSMSIQ